MRIKRILTTLLIALMMFSIVAVTSFAAGEDVKDNESFDIAVDMTSAALLKDATVNNTADGVTVDFTLKIVNNPGVSAITIKMAYNTDKLTLGEYRVNTDVFGEWELTGVLPNADNGTIDISFLTLDKEAGSSFDECDFITFSFKVNGSLEGAITSEDFEFSSVAVNGLDYAPISNTTTDLKTFNVHHYSAVENAPTCLTEGKVIYECTKCGEKFEVKTGDALDHDLGDWVLTTDPTCTEKGEETKSCSRCDYTETREVAAAGHDYEDVVTAPTCTEEGYTTHTCSVCDDKVVDTKVDALGHDWGEWVETKAPTTTAKGENTSTCATCNVTKTEEIAKLPVMTFASEEWKKGEGLTFISDAEFDAFVKVLVNDQEIEAKNYTVTKGSNNDTVVNLIDEYLGTLEAGEYTISIVSTSGTAAANFEIAAGAWWIILIIAAAVLLIGGGVACVIFLKKGREND